MIMIYKVNSRVQKLILLITKKTKLLIIAKTGNENWIMSLMQSSGGCNNHPNTKHFSLNDILTAPPSEAFVQLISSVTYAAISQLTRWKETTYKEFSWNWINLLFYSDILLRNLTATAVFCVVLCRCVYYDWKHKVCLTAKTLAKVILQLAVATTVFSL